VLKNVYISEKLQKDIDKLYLDFLVGLFISACRQESSLFNKDKKQWYLEEMLLHIKSVWPEMDHDQCKSIIISIVDMAHTLDTEPLNIKDYTEKE